MLFYSVVLVLVLYARRLFTLFANLMIQLSTVGSSVWN